MAKFAVILPAAGKSSRFHDKHYKKPFVPLGGDRAVWLHTADRFLNRNDVVQVLLVISPEDREDFQTKFGANIAIPGRKGRGLCISRHHRPPVVLHLPRLASGSANRR